MAKCTKQAYIPNKGIKCSRFSGLLEKLLFIQKIRHTNIFVQRLPIWQDPVIESMCKQHFLVIYNDILPKFSEMSVHMQFCIHLSCTRVKKWEFCVILFWMICLAVTYLTRDCYPQGAKGLTSCSWGGAGDMRCLCQVAVWNGMSGSLKKPTSINEGSRKTLGTPVIEKLTPMHGKLRQADIWTQYGSAGGRQKYARIIGGLWRDTGAHLGSQDKGTERQPRWFHL